MNLFLGGPIVRRAMRRSYKTGESRNLRDMQTEIGAPLVSLIQDTGPRSFELSM
jgi:hypothetical protein